MNKIFLLLFIIFWNIFSALISPALSLASLDSSQNNTIIASFVSNDGFSAYYCGDDYKDYKEITVGIVDLDNKNNLVYSDSQFYSDVKCTYWFISLRTLDTNNLMAHPLFVMHLNDWKYIDGAYFYPYKSFFTIYKGWDD